MGDDSIQVSPTTVRVPVYGGHSEAVNIEFEHEFELDEVRSLLASAPGVVLKDNPAERLYPMPIDCYGRDEVFCRQSAARPLTAEEFEPVDCC